MIRRINSSSILIAGLFQHLFFHILAFHYHISLLFISAKCLYFIEQLTFSLVVCLMLFKNYDQYTVQYTYISCFQILISNYFLAIWVGDMKADEAICVRPLSKIGLAAARAHCHCLPVHWVPSSSLSHPNSLPSYVNSDRKIAVIPDLITISHCGAKAREWTRPTWILTVQR